MLGGCAGVGLGGCVGEGVLWGWMRGCFERCLVFWGDVERGGRVGGTVKKGDGREVWCTVLCCGGRDGTLIFV